MLSTVCCVCHSVTFDFSYNRPEAQWLHENASGWLKQLNVLATHFRHMKPREQMMERHKLCSGAAAAITQLKLSHGEKPFEAECNASYF